MNEYVERIILDPHCPNCKYIWINEVYNTSYYYCPNCKHEWSDKK